MVISIKPVADGLEVNLSGQRYELHDFVTHFPRESTVLAAQFKFFAYLTFDRNYVCSKKIKDIFPLDILLAYIQKDIYSEIKAGLINIFTHSYLNERPRFHKKMQKVFPVYGIRTK